MIRNWMSVDAASTKSVVCRVRRYVTSVAAIEQEIRLGAANVAGEYGTG